MDLTAQPDPTAMPVATARDIIAAHLRWRTGEVDAQAFSHRQVNTALQVLIDATGCRPIPLVGRMT